MSCECVNTSCLDAKFNPCSEGAQLDIVSGYTGVWSAEIEFNGQWTHFTFGVFEDDKIIVPSILLNENYNHSFRVFDEDGNLLNETCYFIKARAIENYLEFGLCLYKVYDIILDDVATDQLSFTDNTLSDGDVLIMTTNAQSYNKDFFTQAGDLITSNGLLYFDVGQRITITMKLNQ